MKLTPLFRGDPRTIVFNILDPDDAPIDLSVSTWASTIRDFATASTGQSPAIDTDEAANGVITLTISGAQSRCLGNRLVGDLEGGSFGTVVLFKADVLSDVTRGDAEPTGGVTDIITLVWGGLPGTEVSTTVKAVLLGGDGSSVALDNHIADTTPHPAYDDLPSLNLLFENALI